MTVRWNRENMQSAARALARLLFPARSDAELMRDSIEPRRAIREYDRNLRREVEIARAQWRADLHLSNKEIEAER